VDSNNYGVGVLRFNYIIEWFLDEARTISVVAPETLPTISDASASVRIFYHKPGKFAVSGSTRSGVSTFSGIHHDDYVLSVGANYGDFIYLVSDGGIMEPKVSENIRVDNTGLPIQEGNDGASYILEGV
jgi:hypothetical protein